MPIDSIPARLYARAKEMGSEPAYYEKVDGDWVSTDWSTYAAEVTQAAKAMIALGVEPGHTVCILGFNRAEWVIFDVAAMAIGAVPAGIYTTCSPNEVQYIVDHSEAGLVLLEDQGQWEKILAERERLPALRQVITMRGAASIDDDLVLGWAEFLANGDGVDDAVVDERLSQLTEEQLATFIYTSGTTGPPKAVMLTHGNLSWTAGAALELVRLTPEDCSLSYLPLSHIAEQMFTIHAPISIGSAVYFAESIDDVPENLKEVQPTVFFGVPRIWEKFYSAVNAKLSGATGVKAKLVAFAMANAAKVSDLRNHGRDPGMWLAARYALGKKLVLNKVKPALGMGRARVCVSGAAPVSADILRFFSGLDLIILEVYGQSEDTGPTTFNRPGATRYGTVGPRIPGIDVKIAEDGEILVKGPNVFKGYYKDEAATAAALTDGWLHSGDLGEFDEEGFLSITGRKKDIIITAGGKNIAPKNIEAALKGHDVVGEAVVIGDRRKFLSALITLDPDGAERFASEHGISTDGLHESTSLIAELQTHIENSVNTLFARVEHIRKFKVWSEPFSIEKGELTPTLKIKRNKVNENYASVIDSMYDD